MKTFEEAISHVLGAVDGVDEFDRMYGRLSDVSTNPKLKHALAAPFNNLPECCLGHIRDYAINCAIAAFELGLAVGVTMERQELKEQD